MPVYNAAKYIGEAIESLRAQDMADWQLIVVDDGSDDHSATIAESYRDARLTVLRQSNAGAASARNTALCHARGAYVVFLDADDVLLPGALRSNADLLDATPSCGAAYSDGYYCDEAGRAVARLSDFRPDVSDVRVWDAMVVSPFLGADCCAMVRRAAIEKRGLRFDPDLVIGEDWDFFLRLAETEAFVANPAVTCKYRVHSRNTSQAQASIRAQQLGHVRLRVVHSQRFSRMDHQSRFAVLYQLLFETFSRDADHQYELLRSVGATQLLPVQLAALYRLVAAHWILDSGPRERIIDCLRQSIKADPWDLRAWLLWVIAAVSLPCACAVLRTRRGFGGLLANAENTSPYELVRAMSRTQGPAS